MIKFFLTFFCVILFSTPALFSSALELNYPEIGGKTLSLGMDLNSLILWVYYFIVGISGLATFVMIVWGGVLWLTSAGDPTKTGEAKERITSALIGLLLVLSSWIILKLINPDLLILSLPGLT